MASVGEILSSLQHAPLRDLDEIVGSRPFLVLAPHPDDESLACGGLIAAACARRQHAFVAFLTDGSQSHPNAPSFPPARLKKVRETEARTAAVELGLPTANLLFLDQKDGHAPHSGPGSAALVDRLVRYSRERHVCTVVTTWEHDRHCDHQAASKISAELCRRIVARHLACPVWGWTLDPERELPAILPAAMRLDIAAYLDVKRRAIAAHRSQTLTWFTTRQTASGCQPISWPYSTGLGKSLSKFEPAVRAFVPRARCIVCHR